MNILGERKCLTLCIVVNSCKVNNDSILRIEVSLLTL